MPPTRFDLNLLVALDVLLAERQVTRAAGRLGLSQPALSAQLKQLREALGDPLLIPAARGMTPTARAEALREPLREALAGLQALIAATRAFDPAVATQTFRIVASDAIHSTSSVRLAHHLARAAPGCRLALLPYEGARTLERMAAGEIDLWLGVRPSLPDALRMRPLFAESFLCVVRPGHPAARRPLDLDTFCALRHVLVSPSGGAFEGTVDEALATLGRRRQVMLSLNSFLLVPELIAGSDFIATVPARLARNWSDRLTVLAPPCEVAGFEVMMGWHPRSHVDPAHGWLRNAMIHADAIADASPAPAAPAPQRRRRK